jgi:replicative DNA helicase
MDNEYRVLPQNIEMEESVLAGCLLFPSFLEDVVDNLLPDHFYRSAHQKIFSAITLQIKQKKPVDLAIISTILREHGLLDEIGGATYLAKLSDAPVPSNMEYACEKLRESATLRKTIEICHKTIESCFDNNDAMGIIDNIQRDILNIDNFSIDNFITMQELTPQSIDRYENAKKDNGDYKIKTGFYEFDTLIGGLSGSKLIIIAGRPRMGKTACMLNMAQYMAQRGDMVGIFEIEMDKEDLDDRLMASLTGINTIRLQSGKYLGLTEWEKITEAASKKYDLPIIIDDTGGIKISELKRRSRKMKKLGCKIIFIDQLSKIIGDRRKSKFEEATQIVEELGHLKKELRIPIVLLAQISRQAITRVGKRPMLEDLKNTGQLEEEGDIVILLHRPFVYTKDPNDEGHALFDVAKARGAPERTINLYWDGKTTSFSNPPQEDEMWQSQ